MVCSIKLPFAAAIMLAFLMGSLCVFGETVARRPNILLIYSDDHGWADVGIQGVDRNIRTPNLDRLALDGVRFVRGYVTAPQCVPSRAGVMTGRYQQRFGVEDNNKGPLPPQEITIAERLKAAGYVTGMVGKWHLDLGAEKGQAKADRMDLDAMPHKQGFDEIFRGELKQYYATHDLAGLPLGDSPKLISDARCRVVVQTEAALSFLNRRHSQPDQPWFLYLGWFAPHVPLESPEPWFSQTSVELPKERRQALAMIAAMDDGLGRIREQLRRMNAEKDTLIFFVGDNGAPLKSGAWNGSLNTPLVGEKGMLTDGGIRTPFLAAWPEHLPLGVVVEHPVSSLDIAATAVNLAGPNTEDSPQSVPPLDGVDLMPYLEGRKTGPPHDYLYWRWRSQAAVLQYPWKLIRLGKHHSYLFDLSSADGENRNLLSEHQEKAAELGRQLDRWTQGLEPSGSAEADNSQDNLFFGAHVDKSLDQTSGNKAGSAWKSSTESPSNTDWIGRNCDVRIEENSMHIRVSDEEGKKGLAFITNSSLNMPGPLTVELLCRASTAGPAFVTWRTKKLSFAPEQTTPFRWSASGELQQVQVAIPENENVIHIRIQLPRGAQTAEVKGISISDRTGRVVRFEFGEGSRSP